LDIVQEEPISVKVSPNPIGNSMTVNQPLEDSHPYLLSITDKLLLDQGLRKRDNQIWRSKKLIKCNLYFSLKW